MKKCPYCAEEIQDEAVKCKHCREMLNGEKKSAISSVKDSHSSLIAECPYCKATSVGKARGLQGVGEVFICATLFFLGMIPGILYYVHVESIPYCSSCGKRVHK